MHAQVPHSLGLPAWGVARLSLPRAPSSVSDTASNLS